MAEIEILKDDWDQFELLDSGNYRRLERYGDLIIIRSEPRAWWKPELADSEWEQAVAAYEREEEKGEWEFKKKIDPNFLLQFDDLKVRLKMTKMSKHIGVFPEQSGQWRWVRQKISQAGRPVKVLNLFAYTGMSTLAAASAGASVTHVDGSKVALTWANENAELSGLKNKPIRWILDDALKFVKREVRRGSKYDAIIMDPPAFGRGPKGEVWKVEDSISQLLESCRELLSENPLFVFVTMYSIESSSISLANLLGDSVKGLGGTIRKGEIVLSPKGKGKLLPLSLFAVWEK
ncbi:MAG TPA: class I SAM-dependent methyltransferase [Candidatus Binatia bacterium]|nr:class I SAM-dependent methyltransferase [Candidatus Binatia bacterium]